MDVQEFHKDFLEEVKATSIDFDGSIFYFPDLANKRIYTKTVDMQGIASLNMYEFQITYNRVRNPKIFQVHLVWA